MKKPAASFLAAGFWNSCDDDNVQVICPTCQIFLQTFLRASCKREKNNRDQRKIPIAASRSLSSGAHSRDPLAPRHDEKRLSPNDKTKKPTKTKKPATDFPARVF
jgi:hypothetical protein